MLLGYPGKLEKLQQDYERMHFGIVKFHQCWKKFEFEGNFFVNTVSCGR